MRSTVIRSIAALTVIFLALASHGMQAQTSLPYQKPPQAIIDLIDTRPTPMVDVSPKDGSGSQWLLIESISGLPSLADLAQPELRLAGLRFNPRTNGPSRGRYITSLMLQALPNGEAKPVSGIPPEARIRFAAWSPNARHIAFVNASDNPTDAGLSLWIIDVASAQAHSVPGIALNGVFGRPCEWSSDNSSLICKTVPKNRGATPKRTEIPSGPVIQENLGRITPGPTYEDLLKNPEDEKIFDYYAASQILVVHLDGTTQPVGQPGVIESASPSPDARYVLVDERHHPYSYVLLFRMFPERIVVTNLATGASRNWPTNRSKIPSRTFICGNGHLAVIEERRWKDRKRVILAVSPDSAAAPIKLFEGSFEDRYHDPGEPFEIMNAAGKLVVQTAADSRGIYFHAEGASPAGARPFLSVMSVTNGDQASLAVG